MSRFVSGTKTRWFGWLGVLIMSLAVIGMLWNLWHFSAIKNFGSTQI